MRQLSFPKRFWQSIAFWNCHHNAMSRIFTIGGYSYQTCLDCGHVREYAGPIVTKPKDTAQ